MDNYIKIFENALEKNKGETAKWNTFLDEYTQLEKNLLEFQQHMEVDIMVPVVNKKALFPGKLYHTGEVTISHGNQLFSNCTTTHALKICTHRLKAAKERIGQLKEEQDLLTNKIELPFDENAFAKSNEQEIIEDYDEDQERMWREKHRTNVKKMKEQEAAQRSTGAKKPESGIFDLLDELEMIEELENELEKLDVEENAVDAETIKNLMKAESRQIQEKPRKSLLSKEGEVLFTAAKIENQETGKAKPAQPIELKLGEEYVDRSEIIALEDMTKTCNIAKRVEIFSSHLKQINKEIQKLRSANETTEASLLKRADLEEIKDYLEDQLDQLQSGSEDERPSSVVPATNSSRRSSVTFAANDCVQIMDSAEQPNELLNQKTLKLKITHSDNMPDNQFTAAGDVIRSPSDIYKKFAHCLVSNKKPILKNKEKVREESINRKPANQQDYREMSQRAKQMEINEAVAFGDVVERIVETVPSVVQPKSGKMSRFKQSRRK